VLPTNPVAPTTATFHCLLIVTYSYPILFLSRLTATVIAYMAIAH
jgi:hypothetical protein